MITGTIPPLTIHRIDDGVKVIANEPYMTEEAEEERWVYTPEDKAWYYCVETGEIRLRETS